MHATEMQALAQEFTLSPEGWREMAIGGMIAVGLMGVGMFVINWVRRRLRGSAVEDRGVAASPFSLNDLRKMLLSGKLSDEEYHRLKDAMVDTARRNVFGGGQSGGTRKPGQAPGSHGPTAPPTPGPDGG
jgi:hypothetical protein